MAFVGFNSFFDKFQAFSYDFRASSHAFEWLIILIHINIEFIAFFQINLSP